MDRARMEQWVIVDTCIWIPFFGNPNSPEEDAIGELIEDDRVALIGPILTELLLGFRRKHQADWVASRLRAAHYIEVTQDDWKNAADLGRNLASQGKRLPLTDLVVAVTAQRCNCFIYSSDPHFDLISKLKRYRPE